jgi:hypothetical protein
MQQRGGAAPAVKARQHISHAGALHQGSLACQQQRTLPALGPRHVPNAGPDALQRGAAAFSLPAGTDRRDRVFMAQHRPHQRPGAELRRSRTAAGATRQMQAARSQLLVGTAGLPTPLYISISTVEYVARTPLVH